MPVTPHVLPADTITKLPPEADGAVIVSGSHGGRYPGYLAARAGARAVILNDAGMGRDRAGIGALAYCEALGIAAATVSHRSCRIGDTADMLARGAISHANAPARDDAAQLLAEGRHGAAAQPSGQQGGDSAHPTLAGTSPILYPAVPCTPRRSFPPRAAAPCSGARPGRRRARRRCC